MKRITLLLVPASVFFLLAGCKTDSRNSENTSNSIPLQPGNAIHKIVFSEAGKFAAWPANNGVWVWDGKEILAGFTVGPYEVKSGHNLGEPHISLLARSLDGGETWEAYDPENYIGDGDDYQDLMGANGPGEESWGLDLQDPELALRITGIGYHGNVLPEGGFYFSQDRGHTWKGPFRLSGLESFTALDTMELSPRTDYVLAKDGSVQVFISARVPGVFGSDRLFCAQSTDGGMHFTIQSWVVPLDDPYRAVMSSTVQCSDQKLVSSIRRREIGTKRCWVDAYVSEDHGAHWEFLSKVGDTGPENGNPPALLMLEDGRLVCAYGQRERRQIIARISTNEGVDWGEEIVLRDDFWTDEFGDADLGYPRMIQRKDGKIVTLYYWATDVLREQHIAATIWDPDEEILN